MDRLLNEEKYKKYSTNLVFIMLIVSFVSELGPVGFVLKPLYPLMIGAAIFLVGYKFHENYKNRKPISTNTLILSVFLLINFISTLINYEYGIWESLDNLIFMFALVYFLYEFEKDSEKQESNLNKLFTIIVKLSAILTSISLLTYVFAISIYIPYPFYIGYAPVTDRLWGIFNPNAGSMMGVITIGLSLYLLENNLNKKNRMLAIYNIVAQFLYIVLAMSRSSIIALFALLVLYTTAKSFNHIKPELSEKNYSSSEMKTVSFSKMKRNRFIQSTLIGIASVALIGFAMKPVAAVVSIFPKTTINIMNTIAGLDSEEDTGLFITDEEVDDSFEAGRKDDEIFKDPNRGRLAYWSSALANIEDSLILGYSHEGIVTEVQEDVTSGQQNIENGGLHNTYITVLGASGLLGLIVYAIWLLKQNIQILSYLYNDYVVNHKLNIKIVLMYAIIIAVHLADFVESRTLYTMSFYSIMTWTLTGIVHRETAVETVPIGEKIFTQRDVLSQELR